MGDTICALATAPGRAAVAVIRISGPRTYEVLRALGIRRPRPRRASLRRLVGRDGSTIDHALTLWFPGPASYTGEDSAELHLHGGSFVVDSVLAALLALGVRLALPGEFTRRAVQNDKLDLGQAEAVADLIDAESLSQARQAVAQLEGALGRRYEAWRSRLTHVLAVLEASVDFPDEALPADLAERALGPMTVLIQDINRALEDGSRGRQIRDGVKVAIIGAPNAGKSSLLNALAGREAAIVTPLAGATRDVIEVHLLIDGYRVVLADMAGLRDTSEVVEAEGVRRAFAWAASADLRLWVIDGAGGSDDWSLAETVARSGDLAVINKSDLRMTEPGVRAASAARKAGLTAVSVSLRSSGGEEVRLWLQKWLAKALAGGDFPATTRLRHVLRLRAARDHLVRARGAVDRPELAAEDVRLAVRELAMVTGSVGIEDVLGEVFLNFCIGK